MAEANKYVKRVHQVLVRFSEGTLNLPPPGPLYYDFWGNCPNCGAKGSAGDLHQHLSHCAK